MSLWHATSFGKGLTQDVPSPASAPLRIEKLTILNPVEEEGPKKTRVLIAGTYPIGQSNGYSRVTYNIAKHLGLKDDIALTIYGFQNYNQTANSEARTDIPPGVVLHDALATEDPRRHGFGEKEIGAYLKNHPQDIVVIFNDMVITTLLVQTIIKDLSAEERAAFKLVSYMDQVYAYQKPNFIQMLNEHFDAVVAFTPYWADTVRFLGLRSDIPVHTFPHGFDPEQYYPIPSQVARAYLGMAEQDFVVLNLNRNQPRKRWDHTLMAWAQVIKRHLDLSAASPTPVQPMRLMIATALDGCWNLMNVLSHELRLLGLDPEIGKRYVMTVPNPQQMSDFEINVLYNACDIGLTTTDGEGFGLCTFEHLAVGRAQVAPLVGGFKEFLHPNNAMLAHPKWAFHVDSQRDGIGGRPEICDPSEVADGIWAYYMDSALRQEHGRRGRLEVLQNYRWASVVSHFHKALHSISGIPRR